MIDIEDAKREHEDTLKAFAEVLSTAAGKRVLFWMLAQCGVYHSSFTGDNNATNYQAGRREVGLELIAQLDAVDPRHYPRMLLELADTMVMQTAADDAASKGNDDDEE